MAITGLGGSTSPSDLSSLSSYDAHGSNDSSSSAVVPRKPRKPMPRKGHTKSRSGCLSCKRRRVKCQETFPECGHCKRLGLPCEWPASRSLAASAVKLSYASPSVALRSTPTQFSIEDMRFFQHFLLNAFPPLPIKGDAVWKGVAALSHSFDYLIHAMLALGATHLALGNGVDYSSLALEHRVQAINSLNHSLNEPCTSRAEGDARFATIMILTFQSSYMPDGMHDFLSMVRGCNVVAESTMLASGESAFRSFSPERHSAIIKSINQGRPDGELENDILNCAVRSVRALAPLCSGFFEAAVVELVELVLGIAEHSYVEAFDEICKGYNVFDESDNDEFLRFIDPANHVAQIALVHFFLVEDLVGTWALQPIQSSFPFRVPILTAWTREVAAKLPPELASYMEWPQGYIEAVGLRRT